MAQIEHFEKVILSPAIPILVRAWGVLLEDKLVDPQGCMIMWDHRVLIAIDDSVVREGPAAPIVGVMSYSKSDWDNQYHIAIGYVLQHRRREGIYTQLWGALVAKAKEEKISRITSSTHIDNVSMQATAVAQGRRLSGYHIEFTVPKE